MKVKRRDFLKAGLAGATLVGATGFSSKSLAKNPEFKFKLQSFLGPGWAEWEVLLPRFIKRIQVMSGGLIEIKAFPPGALSATFDMMDAVGQGVVHMGYGAVVYWKGIWPAMEWIWGIPFALSVVDDLDAVWYERGLYEIVDKAYNSKKVKLLSPIYSDEWGATMSTKPIQSLKDFKGVKIRSFGIAAEIWKMNGAGIVRLPGEELYTGLSTGVIDAVNWGSPYGMMASKLHEVAKYYCGPSLIQYDAEDMFMNMDAFKSMPENLQQCVLLAARIFALERAATSTMSSYEAVGKMKAAGVKFSELPKQEVEQMRKLTDELIQEKAKKDDLSAEVIKLVTSTSKIIDLRPRKVRG